MAPVGTRALSLIECSWNSFATGENSSEALLLVPVALQVVAWTMFFMIHSERPDALGSSR